ncbi:hypothetical protein appser11_20500 [Actinobacillus pleuropneumoniae serovar 11 str. 56153]|nr:hypothetical protein appser9_20380 [Actinobacillus pleuropneumoniae serovar 9 str. CVJ13261]EFM95481.1 hypothetical protein appser10_19850 [Actinobacillus pleuropneumoniae serovar 10 str. D13039]EFM97595.1 hypothetical protein appser11_20500 [Actinobacillus pleuropneumoniae serovar 11 str. 56153]
MDNFPDLYFFFILFTSLAILSPSIVDKFVIVSKNERE